MGKHTGRYFRIRQKDVSGNFNSYFCRYDGWSLDSVRNRALSDLLGVKTSFSEILFSRDCAYLFYYVNRDRNFLGNSRNGRDCFNGRSDRPGCSCFLDRRCCACWRAVW